MGLVCTVSFEIHCDGKGCDAVYYGPTGATASGIEFSAMVNDDWKAVDGKWLCENCTQKKDDE